MKNLQEEANALIESRRNMAGQRAAPFKPEMRSDKLHYQLQAALALVAELEAALHKIAALNPEVDSDEGYNEWGEADCFRQAQEIAGEMLARLATKGPEKA